MPELERYFIDSVKQETRCDWCQAPLSIGDPAWLDTATFAIGCCQQCVRDHNRECAEFRATPVRRHPR